MGFNKLHYELLGICVGNGSVAGQEECPVTAPLPTRVARVACLPRQTGGAKNRANFLSLLKTGHCFERNVFVALLTLE
jgi:hypothetical protein